MCVSVCATSVSVYVFLSPQLVNVCVCPSPAKQASHLLWLEFSRARRPLKFLLYNSYYYKKLLMICRAISAGSDL